MSKYPTGPEKVGIKNIPTNQLFPNPHNPRMLFDRLPMETLRESIQKVGILVPLTVFWQEKGKKFVILDGQRRWMCAKDLGLTAVPVNQVAEPSTVQNIVTMFQIHKLREDWELMPTALKLEVLMKELNEKSEKKLSELTGLNQIVVSRCKKLLSYPKKYQDLMLDPDPNKRVKADFFIELYAVTNDRTVRKMNWFHRDKFTKRMLEKYSSRAGLKAVTDFRVIKQYLSNASKVGKSKEISERLKNFTDNDEAPIESIAIKSADVSAVKNKLLSDIGKLQQKISEIVADDFYGEKELWDALEALSKLIQTKLLDAGRRIKS